MPAIGMVQMVAVVQTHVVEPLCNFPFSHSINMVGHTSF